MNNINLVNIHDKKIELLSFSGPEITYSKEYYLDYYSLAEITGSFPRGFQPDILVVWHPEYYFVPAGIEDSPCFTVACIGDWNLNFLHLGESITRFDYLVTDQRGVNTLKKLGFDNTCYFPLFSLPYHYINYASFNRELKKDYDILFIGSLNADIQTARAPYLYRTAMLADKYRVMINTRVYGQEYLDLLSRSKIIFNRSIRGELNIRVFESFMAGSLLFLEEENEEYAFYFKDRKELVLYNDNNLEELVDYYLENDAERERIAANGSRFIDKHPPARFRSEFFTRVIELFRSKQAGTRKFNSFLPAEKELVIHEEAFITLDKNIYHRLPPLKENFPETARQRNNLLIREYVNNPDSETLPKLAEEAMEQFPAHLPFRVNYLNLLRGLELSARAEEFAVQSLQFLAAGSFTVDNFKGIFINELYTRFHVEYERAFYSPGNSEIQQKKLKELFIWKVYSVLAEVLEKQGKNQAALEAYLQADGLLSTSYLKNRIGNLYRSEGNIKEAYRYYKEGFRLSPFNMENWYNLMILEGETNYALDSPLNREWLTVIEASPVFEPYKKDLYYYEREKILRNLALVENYPEDKTLNEAALKNVLELEPGNNKALVMLGRFYQAGKNYKPALEMLIKSILIKKDREVIKLVADILDELNDQETRKKFLTMLGEE